METEMRKKSILKHWEVPIHRCINWIQYVLIPCAYQEICNSASGLVNSSFFSPDHIMVGLANSKSEGAHRYKLDETQ